MTRPLITISILLLILNSCKLADRNDANNIATDSVSISHGKINFEEHCSGCHNFRQDGIGPALTGLTTVTSASWIRNFVKNPKEAIESGDERAKELFNKYHTVMPSFAYSDNDLNQLIAYLNTQRQSEKIIDDKDDRAIKNPVPSPIEFSGLVVKLQPITQIPHSSDSPPLARITKLDYQPGTKDLFVLDLRGKLYKLVNNQPVVYFDLAKQKPNFINQPGLATGFGSFAFHPDFAKNGLFYTTHAEAAGSKVADFKYNDSIKVKLQWVLCEWKTDHPGSVPFEGTCRELLRLNTVDVIHGLQEITFNRYAKPGDEDYGLLYVGVGDGGSVDNGYPFLPHSKKNVWGTILRIDPAGRNSNNGNYGIPKTNPFVNEGDSVLKEIYAYGFRNPHRITWTKSGLMLLSHVGGANIESINIIEKGHDYGWPLREGPFELHPKGNLTKVYPLPPDDSIYHYTYPVAYFDHDEGKANSGGYEYTGSAVPSLKGKFLFGDIPSGRLFYVETKDLKQGQHATIKEWKISLNGKTTTLRDLCGDGRIDLRFGRDADGEIYIMTKADGKIYKLVN
jgi:mono/diheme cytochrome c family protein